MHTGPFSLFPNTPRLRDLLDRRALRYQWRSGGPVITEVILLLCVAMWAVEIVLRLFAPRLLSAMLGSGMFSPVTVGVRPWALVTSMFLHEPGLWHILFNMLTLWCVGPMLERLMGHWTYLALYLLSGLGGGMGLMLWAVVAPGGYGWLTAAYGASGALFGLFAAMLVVFRRVGADIRSMLVWMGINFAMPLVVPGIAWQAHVGGFLVGGAFALLLTADLPPLRGRSLGVRAWVWGGVLCVAVSAVIVLCSMANPFASFAAAM